MTEVGEDQDLTSIRAPKPFFLSPKKHVLLLIPISLSTVQRIQQAKQVRDEVLAYGKSPLLSTLECFLSMRRQNKPTANPEEAALSHK